MVTADYRGAESKLYKEDWFGLQAVYKKRLPKSYRIEELDFHFRKKRTVFEARLLMKAKEAGVRVPIIYEIDLKNTTLVLEFIEGEILKTFIEKTDHKKRLAICERIGSNIGLLHSKGIIHGDLTTSNIIKLKDQEQLVFIDFGLGYISDKVEDFGIDIYLLERALQNTHPEFFEEIWESVISGYKKTSKYGKNIEKKIIEIASRGRYSERV